MYQGEKEPLTSSTDEKARKALKDLSSSLGASDDVENPFFSHRGSSGRTQEARPHFLIAQLRSNWWLWSTMAFAFFLIGGLIVFRNSLYDTGAHGLPFLAVKDNAAEACTLACSEGRREASAAAGEAGEPPAARAQEAFDACYSKCVVQETREVADEREAFKRTEEEYAREEKEEEVEEEKSKHDDDEEEDDEDSAAKSKEKKAAKKDKSKKDKAIKDKKDKKKASLDDDDEDGF